MGYICRLRWIGNKWFKSLKQLSLQNPVWPSRVVALNRTAAKRFMLSSLCHSSSVKTMKLPTRCRWRSENINKNIYSAKLRNDLIDYVCTSFRGAKISLNKFKISFFIFIVSYLACGSSWLLLPRQEAGLRWLYLFLQFLQFPRWQGHVFH